MTGPLINNVHVDVALSNYSVGIFQDPSKFFADKVFGTLSVPKLSDKFYTFPRGYFNRSEAKERAPGTRAASKNFDISTDTFSCLEYSVEHPIFDEVRSNSDAAIDQDLLTTQLVTHDLLIQRDKLFTQTYLAGGVWTGGDVDGVASSASTNQVIHWSDETNGTPVSDIDDAMTAVQQATGYRPNVCLMTRDVFDKVKRHPEFIDLVNGGATTDNPALANEALMERILGVERVVLAESIENTAKEGQTDSHSFIASKKCLLTYVPPRTGLMVPSAGTIFSWQAEGGFQVSIDKYREEAIKTDFVRGSTYYDMKLVSAELGYFFDNIIA